MKTILPNQKKSRSPKFAFGKDEFSLFKKSKVFSLKEREEIVVEGQSGIAPIGEICMRYNITPNQFYNWSNEFIQNQPLKESSSIQKSYSEEEKFRLVLDGLSGVSNVLELCRTEGITHDQFLRWSEELLRIRENRLQRELEYDLRTKEQKEKILKVVNEVALNYFESYLDVTSNKVFVGNCSENSQLKSSEEDFKHIFCLSKVNDTRFINKHFEKINQKLPLGGFYLGFFETFSARKKRLKISKVPILNNFYFGLEFLFKRVIPKLKLTQKIYFYITKGEDRLLSKAEVLGRLVSCGFQIVDFKSIDGLVYFVVKKDKDPEYNMNPSYGPVYRMPRIGKNGKIIKVFKFRTMHPYSEYLQEFMVKTYGYSDSGKPENDFRIPAWGKIMRKYWLDELPQLINVLKGDMKLVGIRPLSIYRFNEIPKEMQKLRLPHKPGCIPPYISLNRKSDVLSLLQAEKYYIQDKINNPYTTDVVYFFTALYNIVIKKRRSA